MNDLLNLIPVPYGKYVLASVAISPYITRAIHALQNGGGLKGVLSAIWLGTNTPKKEQELNKPI